MNKRIKKILILCVDHDDDVGVKAGVDTPILGEEEVEKAALKLISVDPSEADANTMFESLRLLRSVKEKNLDEEYEIAVVAGSPLGGVEADRRVSEEIQEVLDKFKADAAILVSDGYSDQVVAPVIQSFIPIISVRRFAVKHSETLETSWFIILTYLKSIFSDKRYSRWTLGIPGLIITLFTVFFLLTLFYPEIPFLSYASAAAMLIVGLALLIKGFGIDEYASYIARTVSKNPPILFNLFATIVLITLTGMGVAQAVGKTLQSFPLEYFKSFELLLPHLGEMASVFIDESVSYFILGLTLFILGRMSYYFFSRDERFWGGIPGITTSILLGEAVRRAAYIAAKLPGSLFDTRVLQLILWIVLSIAVIGGVTALTHKLRGKYSSYFQGKGGGS